MSWWILSFCIGVERGMTGAWLVCRRFGWADDCVYGPTHGGAP